MAKWQSQNESKQIKTMFLSSVVVLFVSVGIIYTVLSENGNILTDMCQMLNYSYVCQGNFGIPRHEMPQLDFQGVATYLDSVGMSWSQASLAPSLLTPIQGEINANIVNKILLYNESVCDDDTNPIIVAQVNETQLLILDGHHRYAACRIAGKNISSLVFDGGHVSDIDDVLKPFRDLNPECHWF